MLLRSFFHLNKVEGEQSMWAMINDTSHKVSNNWQRHPKREIH